MDNKGFTFIEIILVVSIVTIISLMSAAFYSNFLTQNAVANTTNEIVSELRKAQLYAMIGKQSGGNWGVKYTSTPKQVTLYLEGNSAFDEPFSVNPNVTVSPPFDVVFNHYTGAPPVGSSSFGNSTSGSITDNCEADNMEGAKITIGSSAVAINSLSVLVGPVDASPRNQYQMAIYTDSGGQPTAEIASTATGNLTGNTWNTLAISANLSANTSYWLLYNNNGSNCNVNGMKYDNTSSGIGAFKGHSFGSWPISTGGGFTLGTWQFNIIANTSSDTTYPLNITISGNNTTKTVSINSEGVVSQN